MTLSCLLHVNIYDFLTHLMTSMSSDVDVWTGINLNYSNLTLLTLFRHQTPHCTGMLTFHPYSRPFPRSPLQNYTWPFHNVVRMTENPYILNSLILSSHFHIRTSYTLSLTEIISHPYRKYNKFYFPESCSSPSMANFSTSYKTPSLFNSNRFIWYFPSTRTYKFMLYTCTLNITCIISVEKSTNIPWTQSWFKTPPHFQVFYPSNSYWHKTYLLLFWLFEKNNYSTITNSQT